MLINIIAEGCYPYTVGGVSSWVQMLMTHFSSHEFLISTVLPDEDADCRIRYSMPSNVKSLDKAYLYNQS